jgi:hypothetical protein
VLALQTRYVRFWFLTFYLNIFMDIWFQIRIEHRILNIINTLMAVIILIFKKFTPRYKKKPGLIGQSERELFFGLNIFKINMIKAFILEL